MPKTSKKSKASKSTGLRKRFDLTNKKVQFFVVIAIVAILGGGWFTYKSFAATVNSTVYPTTQGGVGYFSTQTVGTMCSTKKASDSSKNNQTVQFFACSPGPGNQNIAKADIAFFSDGKIPFGTYKACLLIKGSSPYDQNIGTWFTGQYRITAAHVKEEPFPRVEIDKINPNSYTKICSRDFVAGNGTVGLNFWMTNDYGNTTANIANATLEKVTSSAVNSSSSK